MMMTMMMIMMVITMMMMIIIIIMMTIIIVMIIIMVMMILMIITIIMMIIIMMKKKMIIIIIIIIIIIVIIIIIIGIIIVITFNLFRFLYVFFSGAFNASNPLIYFSFQPVLHDWCNKVRGTCYPVCGMVHIKEPLLLIGKSSLCGGSGFPFSLSEWSLTVCLTPYNRR